MKGQNVEDHGGKQRQTKWHKATNQKEQTSNELNAADHIYPAAGNEDFYKIAGKILSRRRHRQKMEEGICPKHGEDQSQEKASYDGCDFHAPMLAQWTGNSNQETRSSCFCSPSREANISGIVLNRRLIVVASTFGLLTTGLANAEPFEDFFDALKRAFTQPTHRTHRGTQKSKSTPTPTPQSRTTDGEVTAGVQRPPSGTNTRTASRASSQNSKTGLKYGTPVPGKKGFVTSPFSPDSGYIDVRGFPPGTAVKDPYSGKIILTP